MSEGHCHNCRVRAELNEVISPDGELYWVCDNCKPQVEEGYAYVVRQNET